MRVRADVVARLWRGWLCLLAAALALARTGECKPGFCPSRAFQMAFLATLLSVSVRTTFHSMSTRMAVVEEV